VNIALIGLDISLIALVGVTGGWRRNILTCTQKRYNKNKAWATTLNKTYPLWPKNHETRHAKASKVIRTKAY
jgi:hypothetical protein